MKEIIDDAVKRGLKTLSEYDSKKVIASAGVPVTREKLARSREEALRFAEEILSLIHISEPTRPY